MLVESLKTKTKMTQCEIMMRTTRYGADMNYQNGGQDEELQRAETHNP